MVSWERLAAVILAGFLVLAGLLVLVVRLAGVDDRMDVGFGWTYWRRDMLENGLGRLPGPRESMHGAVYAIEGYSLSGGPGILPKELARPGAELDNLVRYKGVPEIRAIRLQPADPALLTTTIWGLVVGCVVVGGGVWWLRLRRPTLAALAPLIMMAGAGTGATLVTVAAMSVVDVAAGAPVFWLWHGALTIMGPIGMGALLRLAWRAPAIPWWLPYVLPVGMVLAWAAIVQVAGPGGLRDIGLIHVGSYAACLLSMVAAPILGWRPLLRATALPGGRWLLGGCAVSYATALAVWVAPELLTGDHLIQLRFLGLVSVPAIVGGAVAVLRYHLLAIRRPLSVAITHALLAGGLYAVFAAAVAGVTVLAGIASPNTAVLGAAAVLVAMVLLPLRDGLRRLVERVVYGHRDDPRVVMAAINQTLAVTHLPTQILPALVAAVAEALRLPYVAIELSREGGFGTGASVGRVRGPLATVELRHQAEVIGRLVVSARDLDDPLPAADLVLLTDVAGQLGAAARAVLLHEELLRSRRSIVTSREDERKRMRRELHDRLSPDLTAVAYRIELTRRRSSAGETDKELEELARQVLASVEEIRRVAYELRPPALDELGLGAAVRELGYATPAATLVSVELPDDLEGLPPAVEVAAYRIIALALANVMRHAAAPTCLITLRRDGELAIEVTDDGRGLPYPIRKGVGMVSMRERAEELGGTLTIGPAANGGTQVLAHLPLDTTKEH
ncbi:hypothetical protein GCM10022419_136200 [Nonomuraea rosea]|uniref:histidine kinase n=1 Tax=Nonomuraea rosea TaxID=638574 RepID=A0ABP7A9U6_9ACTN